MYLALAGVIALESPGIAWCAAALTPPGSRQRVALARRPCWLSVPLAAARTIARHAEYALGPDDGARLFWRDGRRRMRTTWSAPSWRQPEDTKKRSLTCVRRRAGIRRRGTSLARSCSRLGRIDEGISELRAFVRDEPGLLASRAAHGLLANALAGQQDFAAAIPHYREYLAAHAEDANGWNGLGIALLQSGKRPRGAIEAFRGAVKPRPANPGFQMNLARALLDEGRLDEAARLAEQSAAAAPNPGGPRHSRAGAGDEGRCRRRARRIHEGAADRSVLTRPRATLERSRKA